MGFTTSELNSNTRRYIYPVMVENIWKSNATFVKLRTRQEFVDGGTSLNLPTALIANPNAMHYTGLQTLAQGQEDESTTAQLNWAQYNVSVTLSGLNIFANRGAEAVMNIVKAKIALAERALRDLMGTEVFGTTADTGGSLAGLQVAIDDGTNYATYATINRSTYTGWQSVYNANSGTGRALTLSLLQKVYTSTRIDAASPKLAPTTQGLYNKIWNLIQPQQRFADENMAKIGFPNLMFNDAMVYVDSKVQSTAAAEHFYFLNPDTIGLYTFREMNFRFIPFVINPAQDGYVCHIRFYGQVLVDSPRLNGKIVDLDSTL